MDKNDKKREFKVRIYNYTLTLIKFLAGLPNTRF